MNNWYVYLARCSDDSLYCGITTDIERRFKQHNGLLSGGAKYTKGRRPVVLCASAICKDKSSASRLEAKIRVLPRPQKIETLQSYSQENIEG